MWIAQNSGTQQLDVPVDLTGGVQATSGVVQVDVIALVEPGIFHAPQFAQCSVRIELREPMPEVGLGLIEVSRLISHSKADGSCC